jgi:hypothetical protein
MERADDNAATCGSCRAATGALVEGHGHARAVGETGAQVIDCGRQMVCDVGDTELGIQRRNVRVRDTTPSRPATNRQRATAGGGGANTARGLDRRWHT